MPDPSPENKVAETKVEATDVKDPTAGSSPADTTPPEKPAEKPASKEAKGEKPSMLDAVKAAIKPKPDKAPASDKPDPAAVATETKPEEGEEAEETDELTDEETTRLKRKTKKRIDTLLEERTARDKTIEELGPKAQQLDQIVRFVGEAGLTKDEVNQTFDVARDLKNNPRKAYEALKPIFGQLQVMFGDVLPQDLQQQVARGQISADQARALTQARTNAAVAEQQNARLVQQNDDRQRQATVETQVSGIKDKVSEWESSKEKSDPDWKLKRPHVMRAVETALLKRGMSRQGPPTAAEAVELATKALAEVESDLKDLAPRRREMRPVTEVTSTPSTAKPKSMLEAARMGMAKRG